MARRHLSTGPRVFAVDDIAEAWGVSAETVRRWCARGSIAHLRTPSGQLRFPLSAMPDTDGGEAA